MPHVTLPQFEGPLELLLELITAEKLEISQIALAEVTDQYLGAIYDMEAVRPAELADFLVIASTLLLIKSRKLLPQLAISSEEEEEILSLEERLKEYQRYRKAGKVLHAMAERGARIYTRPLWQGFVGGFYPPAAPPSPQDLAENLARLVRELTALLRPPETKTIARIVSVEEKIREVLVRIERAARFTMEELAGSQSRAELILAFLALLFLFRQKAIMLSQSVRFGKIEIRKFEEHGGR
jgi:segregation and condensation protein A